MLLSFCVVPGQSEFLVGTLYSIWITVGLFYESYVSVYDVSRVGFVWIDSDDVGNTSGSRKVHVLSNECQLERILWDLHLGTEWSFTIVLHQSQPHIVAGVTNNNP